MADIGYIFPGQGAQYVGMGKDIYDKFSSSREIFHNANELLEFDLIQLCFEGPEDELKKTENCQVAILTVSIATVAALNSQFTPAAMAGLSLGEYSALVAAGSIDFKDAIKLVRRRGQFMQDAANEYPGGMVSIIGLEKADVEKICQECNVEIANLNSPGQIVVSGSNDALSKVVDKAESYGAKRAVILDVSGPFHSSLMAKATQRMETELNNVKICSPNIPVVSNVTANFESAPDKIKNNLKTQISNSTRWEESMRFLISRNINMFLEIGPGKILKGLMRRIDSSVEVKTIETTEDITNVIGK